ncbi:deoxyribodipyrimidine photo-lyase [Rhodanobacter sp. DHG33]|uniref:cryptochrome/photolyase family protein n=1 Tax=Rhodanobacter sp. DHG33 TaxID=2775921 RepID=UPI0017855CA5|nr:deoxyribodipyrimidine photo-lyase [Rhodanobacter sp. DHG33]MBD8898543.1 deoxyribodipyrimidine photo-lyase [Rhodanobacter sp. DHG33]
MTKSFPTNHDTALVLFRRDLRLTDHPALAAACAEHECVLPLYLHSSHEEAPWSPGGASRWWLHHSLEALQRRLAAQQAVLHIAQGDCLPMLRALIATSGARTVYWSRRYEPTAIAHDTALKLALRGEGITVHSVPGNLWCEPWQLATMEGQPYRVFTPFWRKLRTQLPTEAPLPEAHARDWMQLPGSLPLDTLELLPRIPWSAGLAEHWQPGEAGALELLDVFADDALADYAGGRDLPARHGTSRLSPHLHFGEITPRQILYALQACAGRMDARRRPDLEPYLRELGWREFAHHLLYHFPKTPTENFNSRFDAFHWADDNPAFLRRWQQGRTGIPLVDAGMRELWHTGWMHNRVRMIAASFLTKNLRMHWHHGARWFWDTLVDADLANNTLGWQWVAGCGADAAPYFRVFNPYTQAAKFDPEASYLKRWLPELAQLPAKLLHEPWRDPGALSACGYPLPMVDIGATREAALRQWQALSPR